MRGFLLCLVTSLFLANPLFAQAEPDPGKLGWVTLGLGYVEGNEQDAATLGIEASFQHGGHLFSGRLLAFDELSGHETTGTEAALLYGRTRRGKHHHLALSAGLAYLDCQRYAACGGRDWENPDRQGGYHDYNEPSRKTAGLALAGQAFWTPAGWFGLGLFGFANINPHGSFVGVMFGLRFGKLRN